MSFLNELKRRNVLRVGVAYLVSSWLLIQVAETIIPLFGFDDTPARLVVIVLAIGFIPTLVVSWVFEITPEGLKRDADIDHGQPITQAKAKKLDRIILVVLALALAYFTFDKFVWDPVRDESKIEIARQEGRIEAIVESYGDKSIAVLPFVNMSSDPEQEYFSDGISEELLNLLARIPELRVISRSSAFSFKGKDITIPEVAKQLRVEHVLEGSIRKAGERVRITVQLIKARSDTHLWSEVYDRELGDIFAIQEEIASVISKALVSRLVEGGNASAQPRATATASTAAYDAYLRGMALSRLRIRSNLEQAVSEFERALQLDENFAPAHAQLAKALLLKSSWSGVDLDRVEQSVITHLDRAQELNPKLADIPAVRALLTAMRGDNKSAIELSRKALAMNPSDSDVLNFLYVGYLRLGDYKEADATIKHLLEIDPLSAIGRFNYSWELSDKGRISEAQVVADQMIGEGISLGFQARAITALWYEGEIADGLGWTLRFFGSSRAWMFFALVVVGEFDEAIRVIESWAFWVDTHKRDWDAAVAKTQKILNSDPENLGSISNAAQALYLAKRFDEARPLYERLLDAVPEGRPIQELHSLDQTVSLAVARRKTGDEPGAQAALKIVVDDLTARRASGIDSQQMDRVEAMIAAFNNEPGHAIEALRSAIGKGLRDKLYFDYPVFEGLRDDVRFIALQQELGKIVEREHEKVLQLICFKNPVPDLWQPMPDTCKGVEKQSGL